MWDVLEHLQNLFYIKKLNKLLSKDGTFCFTTIDIDTWFPKLTRSKWPWIMEMHLLLFKRFPFFHFGKIWISNS